METFHKHINQPLNWVPVGFSRKEFELRGENQILAIMKWPKHFGLLASAITADGEWNINRSGFLHSKINVRSPDSNNDIAVLMPNRDATGTVEFHTGHKVFWVNKNNLRSAWAFVDQNGEDILHFQCRPKLVRLKVGVTLLSDRPESPLLACLGLYLLVLTHEEYAAEINALVPVMVST
jgi:hypothetical protein